MTAETFWCPRRAENGAEPGPNGELPAFFPEMDSWRSGDHRTCSYCGSLHPDNFFEYVERGGEVVPTDKSYKVYLKPSPDKFYLQHLDETAKRRFVDLLNAKKVVLGYPGYFYVKPFFITYEKPTA